MAPSTTSTVAGGAIAEPELSQAAGTTSGPVELIEVEYEPLPGVIDNDAEALAATGIQGMLRLVMATHRGVSPEEFARTVDGHLDKALAQAPERGWTVVDMQRDWKVVYPFD